MGFFRSTLKAFIDIPSWMGLNQLKRQTNFLLELIKPIFKPRITTHTDTFEAALQRFNIKEEELENIKKRYIYYTLFYSAVGLLCIIYTGYLFFYKHLFAGIVMILISMMVFLKAFSTHFWYFEIKNRKLGCTLREWLNGQIEDKSNV